MKKFLVAGFLVSMFFSSKCQLDSLSRVEYDAKLNDVWGYVDTSGNEYALVGLRNGLSIVEVTNFQLMLLGGSDKQLHDLSQIKLEQSEFQFT